MEICCTRAAEIFKALGDEQRLKILALLMGCEKCACKLLEALHISQPTLSHHMKILCAAGIVEGRKEGKWMHYRIAEDGTLEAKMLLEALNAGCSFGCRRKED